jgi:hypothetical protein
MGDVKDYAASAFWDTRRKRGTPVCRPGQVPCCPVTCSDPASCRPPPGRPGRAPLSRGGDCGHVARRGRHPGGGSPSRCPVRRWPSVGGGHTTAAASPRDSNRRRDRKHAESRGACGSRDAQVASPRRSGGCVSVCRRRAGGVGRYGGHRSGTGVHCAKPVGAGCHDGCSPGRATLARSRPDSPMSIEPTAQLRDR